MCIKQTLVERAHADRGRGWDNGSGVSWELDIVPLVDAYDAAIAEVERLRSTNELLEQEARIRKNLCDGFASEAAEIERLREEAHEMRLWAEEAARAENANAEDAKKERATVVDFVRGARLDELADAIERGDHRREEGA